MRAKLGSIRLLGLGLLISIISLSAGGCQGGNVSGNDGGSEPINNAESVEYKKAIVRCYKTGGTRVVKIMGELQCY